MDTPASAQAYEGDPRNETALIWVNGDLLPRDRASVSVFDAGFVLGDGTALQSARRLEVRVEDDPEHVPERVAHGPEPDPLADVLHRLVAPVEVGAGFVVSAVGAGDSFVAGFLLATAQRQPVDQALALGAAAASAACMTPATDLCHAADVWRLYEDRVVTRL